MASPLLIGSAFASGAATLAFVPWLIRSLKGTSAVGRDLNKPGRPLVPEMGGLGVMLGFYVGVAVLVILPIGFLFDPSASEAIISPFYSASLGASLGAGVVGMMDDMFSLRKRTKAFLPFLLALPLGAQVFVEGDRTLLVYDIGPLIIFAVALGVTSAGNAANMLEGFNGLSAGLLIIIDVALILISLDAGADEGLYLLFPLLGSLVAFLWFNRFPARVFPGDSMPLFAGAAIACAAIISTPPTKTLAALLFLPMIVEFALKARGRFRAENYGGLRDDGRLQYAGRVESLTHILMRRKPRTEFELVSMLWVIQLAVAVAVVAVAFTTSG